MVPPSMTLIGSWLHGISRSRYFSTLNILETTRDRAIIQNINRKSYALYRMVTFSIPPRTLNPVFKVTAFLKSIISKNGVSYGHSSYSTLIWKNDTMFGDFDWPVNASRGLSAIAEFLVCFVYKCRDWNTTSSLLLLLLLLLQLHYYYILSSPLRHAVYSYLEVLSHITEIRFQPVNLDKVAASYNTKSSGYFL